MRIPLTPLLRILESLCVFTLATQVIALDDEYDYVIIGGGTAGLVVANRLSADPSVSVLVIEAGDFERNNPNVTNATALGIGKYTRLDWQYASQPQASTGNRSVIWCAGKGMGGSSLINGMTYMRPTSSQINHWVDLGLEIDWDILFNSSKKGEHFQFPSQRFLDIGAGYNLSAHGLDGPLSTCISPNIPTTDIHEVFNQSMQALGIPPRDEFNGGDLLGYGIQMATQDSVLNVREDAARAYYYPFMDRPNLAVLVNSTGLRIIWDTHGSSNDEVVGSAVEYRDAEGTIRTASAKHEIILSAGAIRSPGILERSGVGRASLLQENSIPVTIDLPAVGENFQDQPTIAVVASSFRNTVGLPGFVAHISMHDLFGDETESVYSAFLSKIPEYAALIASQNGGGSSAAAQERLLRGQLDLMYSSNTPTSELVPIAIGEVTGVVFWLHQPLSRGSVHMNISDPDHPIIVSNMLQLDFDAQLNIATSRWVRKFMDTEPFASTLNASTITPMLNDTSTDAEWLDFIKTTSQPNYHHLGTTAMLPRDLGGVVDNDFRVYGTSNVRVVDLGVVPVQVAGHSTAPLYGIAEWAAQKIMDGYHKT